MSGWLEKRSIEMSKNPWAREQLEQFVGQDESYELEFKSSRDLREAAAGKAETFFDDLSAHVSAFLNSDGGLLLIGIEETARRGSKAGLASCLSEGVPRSLWNGDRVSNKLCDRVHPAVASYVRVHTVKVGVQAGEDLLAFVVEVKPGITAYQAGDKRYYSRRGFSSNAMEDKDVRLRMLADDRPRGELRVRAQASPSGTSLDHLATQLGDYEEIRQMALKVGPPALDGDQSSNLIKMNANLEARFARPQAVTSIDAYLYLSLANTGSVTIRRGAVSWSFEQAGSSAIRSKEAGSSKITQFTFDTDDRIPLYPEREEVLMNWACSIPRKQPLESDESALDVVVYLDGGPPVRQRIIVAQEIEGAVAEVEDALLEIGRKHELGEGW